MRQLEIVERLLEAGAGLEQRLPGEVTVLMLAAALGLPETRRAPAAPGAPTCMPVDAQGLTPLHCAALYGFTARDRTRLVALLDALLLAGADPSAPPPAACHATAVAAGCARRARHAQRRGRGAVRRGAAVRRGRAPGCAGSCAGSARCTWPACTGCCGWSQRAAARRCRSGPARHLLNRTPREIAVMRGYVDVAAELALPGNAPQAPVSMARFLRE
jgi:hypothetical protein